MSEEIAAEAAPESPSVGATSVPESTSGVPDGSGSTAEAQAGSTPSEAETEPQEWSNFLKKYNGDKAAAGRAYWEGTKSAAETARERDELRQRLAEYEASKEPPKAPEPPPRLQALEKSIKSFEAEKNELETQRNSIPQAIAGLDKEIAILEFQIARSDDLDKPGLQAQLRAVQAERTHNIASWQTKGRELARLDWQLQDLQDRREGISQEFEAERERQEQAEAANQKFMVEFPQKIDGLITSAAQKLGIAADKVAFPSKENPKGGYLWRVVYNDLMSYCYGRDVSQTDFNALVNELVNEHGASLKGAAATAFQNESKKILEVKTPVSSLKTPPRDPQTGRFEPQKPSWAEVSDWRDLPEYASLRKGMR